ncbi:MAG TPA: SBBP repeat-containing protein [Verrucomicrobiae bacterium]
MALGQLTVSAVDAAPGRADGPSAPAISAAQFFELPMQFEANAGQAGEPVQFLSRGAGYTLLLAPTEAILSLRNVTGRARSGKPSAEEAASGDRHQHSRGRKITHAELRMTLLGANARPRAEGVDALAGTVNYFVGNNPANWRTGIPTFAKVKYRAVYPGVDLIYYCNQRQVEYDFVVGANADPGRIAFGFTGADRLEIDDEGGLVAHVASGMVRWPRPFAYQETESGRKEIPARFDLKDGHRVGFQVSEYDPGRPLIIDPVLVYSTFLGASGDDYVSGIVVDASGNVFVVGDTTSLSFPTSSAYDSSPNGSNDVFVTKLNASGSGLVYSTYLGGNADEYAGGIAVDSSGNAYVTGQTLSGNFPTTPANAFSTSINAGVGTAFYDGDAFVAKLGPAGNTLLYSSFLGGEFDDSGDAIAADNSGNVYVAGGTFSIGTGPNKFPTFPNNAFQGNNNGIENAFVAKFNTLASGTASLVYSTFLGGSGGNPKVEYDHANGIAIDASGNAYVTGEAAAYPDYPAVPSSDFPLVLPAFQSSFNRGNTDPLGGNTDAFVTKINSTGTGLIFSTFLGGGDNDAGMGITLDAGGRIYVVGETMSTNFPTLNGAQPAISDPDNTGFPAPDLFITEFPNAGTSLVYSTYFGGSDYESGFGIYRAGIAVDGSGYVYVTGQTTSFDFPFTVGADQTNAFGQSEAFVAKINPAVPGPAGLAYATLFGGDGDDRGIGVAVDTNGNFYVAGTTSSVTNFPVTPGAFRTNNGGGYYDTFVAKFSSPRDLSVVMTPSIDPVIVGSNLTYTIRINNNGRSSFNNVTNFVQFATNFQIGPITTTAGSYTVSGGLVTFNVGNMTNNASVVQTIVATASSPAVTTNAATLTSTETPTLEPNTGNNLSTVTSTIRGIADVTLTKSAAPDPVLVGSDLTYTIGVRNKGPWPATSVMLTDPLPAAVTLVSVTNTLGSCTTNGGVVVCNFSNMANGALATVTIVVIPRVAGLLTNAASVTAFELDTASANNSSNLVTTVTPVSDLALGQTAAPEPVLAGNTLSYTFSVTNYGPSTASGVVLTDPLPPGSVFVSATSTQGACSQTNGVVTCNLGGLASNSTATVAISVRPMLAGVITNTGSITSDAVDLVAANNSASAVSTVNPVADLSISQTALPGTTTVSNNVAFTIVVTNRGPSVATGVVVTDSLSPAFTFVSAQSPQGTCAQMNGIVTCNLNSLGSNATATVTLIVMAASNGIFANTASVTATESDLSTNNNTATVTVNVGTTLAVRRAGTNVVLSWPSEATGFTLQFKSVLLTNFGWMNLTNVVPVVVSNRFTVTNPITSTNGFYRLFK